MFNPLTARHHFALAWLSYAAASLILFAAGIAFASDGAASADPVALLAGMLDAVENGEWWLAAGPALTLSVLALKKWDQDIPRVGPAISRFLDQPAMSFALPTLLSAATGLFGALATGTAVKPALIAAVKVSATAIATYVGAKKVAEQMKGGGQ